MLFELAFVTQKDHYILPDLQCLCMCANRQRAKRCRLFSNGTRAGLRANSPPRLRILRAVFELIWTPKQSMAYAAASVPFRFGSFLTCLLIARSCHSLVLRGRPLFSNRLSAPICFLRLQILETVPGLMLNRLATARTV